MRSLRLAFAAVTGAALLAGTAPPATAAPGPAGDSADPAPAPQEATMPEDTTRSMGGVQFGDTLRGDGPRGEELDALTAKVASQLRCTVCRNQSVVESSATLSQQMQAEIRRRLAAGQSPEEVKQYFVSRYGEWILLQPKAEGINLLVYILPGLALVGGLVLVWIRIRQWTRSEAGAGDRATPTTARPPGQEPVGAGEPVARRDGDGRGDAPGGEGLSERERRRLDDLIREGS